MDNTTTVVDIDRFAHGGETVARLDDGRVVFLRGGIPGDTATIALTEIKKKFARGVVSSIVSPSPDRVPQRCPAAAAGAGCCDFGELNAEKELPVKSEQITQQLRKIGGLTEIPTPDLVDFHTPSGWRTRVRLGVDKDGRAGFRVARSRSIVTDAQCTQAVPGLLDGIVGDQARFRPHAELVVVVDSTGTRHVVETRKVGRGKRIEHFTSVVEGTGEVREQVGDTEFEFPATGFWQAHRQAPAAYAETVHNWVREAWVGVDKREDSPLVAWDLYGGVGLFVPALTQALECARVYSVEMSPYARSSGQKALRAHPVTFVKGRVERKTSALPQPDVVVLDPPRQGAGAEVISQTAAKEPKVVVHIGCDAATFARDAKSWVEQGYQLSRLRVFNAFPGTHHCETFGLFTPTTQSITE